MSQKPLKKNNSFVKTNPRKKGRTATNQNLTHFQHLPQLRKVSEREREQLLVQKLQQCCILFDFHDPEVDKYGKAAKSDVLTEVNSYLQDHPEALNERVSPHVLLMIATNLFRTLPPNDRPDFDPDQDEPSSDPAWPHLEIIYAIFRTYLDATDVQPPNQAFVLQLLQLFDSEDPRERQQVRHCLHHMYSRWMDLRPFVRQQINNILLRFIYETEEQNGVRDILEFLECVIIGLSLPLQEEHIQTLKRILIPLHKTTRLALYAEQLAACVLEYVRKDAGLAETVLRGLLKHWPRTCSIKEIIFIEEMRMLLRVVQQQHVQQVLEPMFVQVARCMVSSHHHVQTKALELWTDEGVARLVAANLTLLAAVMTPVLCNTEVAEPQLIAEVLNVLKDAQPQTEEEVQPSPFMDPIPEDPSSS